MNILSKKSNLGWIFLLVLFLLTFIYSKLYSVYLDPFPNLPSLGGHIAGFFGLFVPVGILTIFSAIFLSTYVTAIKTSFILIFVAVLVGNRLPITGKIGKILYILLTLLIITFISDMVRQTGFLSWYIFIHGSLPPLS